MKVMKNNNLNARKLMSKLVPDLVMKPVVVDENILFSILTPQARWTDQQKEMINVLAR